MRKIIAFTKYSSKGPSSRYRTFQFIPYWQKNGYTIDVNILFNDDYVNRLYKGKSKNLFSIIFLYVKRICKIILLKNKYEVNSDEVVLDVVLSIFLFLTRSNMNFKVNPERQMSRQNFIFKFLIKMSFLNKLLIAIIN